MLGLTVVALRGGYGTVTATLNHDECRAEWGVRQPGGRRSRGAKPSRLTVCEGPGRGGRRDPGGADVFLTVVGCSGTFPGRDSCCSSYLVVEDGFRLVLDVGNGSIGSLQHHTDVLDVDAVVLSHLHGDHCLDLVPYSYARRYHPQGRPPLLPVVGPADTRERLCNAFESPPEEGLRDVYAFQSIRPGKIEIGPFAVEFFPVAHPVEAYAIRLETAGRSLAYSGDTGPCVGLLNAADEADLLLCEASWQDATGLPPNLHLTARQAAEHADKAGVDRLLLTHLLPWLRPDVSVEQAAVAFAGPLGLASTGTTYEV